MSQLASGTPIFPSAPKHTPLPHLPTTNPLTPDQWRTLLAVADTVIPSLLSSASMTSSGSHSVRVIPDDEYKVAVTKLRALIPRPGAGTAAPESREDDGDSKEAHVLAETYLAESASSNPRFSDALLRFFGTMPQEGLRNLAFILNLLNYRASCLILTGYAAPFHQHSVQVREAILQQWSTARIPLLRQLLGSLTTLVKANWTKTSPTLGPVLGFPRTPVNLKPGKGFSYEFIQFPPGDQPEVVETDVVIVGSGCGGGVCAKNIAEAGHRVLVVEKSYYWPPEHLPMTEEAAQAHMFMNGSAIVSDDQTMSVFAGQTWGGGGTVNWSASLQTQGFVREEWANSGLPFFTSGEFQASLDRVCHRMGVSTEHIRHNKANRALMEGARRLGWSVKPVPQNTGGAQHYCGYCTLGCGSCEKQGPMVSFLPDAARAGAKFIEGFDAREILFGDSKGGAKTAVGVRGNWLSRDENGGVVGSSRTRREVIIKAKRVIVSAGTLQSPLLLLRSKLRNPNIGRHLHLHPAVLVGAIYDDHHDLDGEDPGDDGTIRPWEGGILTSVVTEFENLDGRGHGVKMETAVMLPATFLPFPTWLSGLDYKLLAAHMRRMTGNVTFARERDAGTVYPDPVDGRPRLKYTVSSFDRKHILEGVIAHAKIQYIAGAREIFVPVPGVPRFVRTSDCVTASSASDSDAASATLSSGSEPKIDQGLNDPAFQSWLSTIRRRGLPSPESMFASAHQMGSCRMGSSPKTSVVDPFGKVWGTEALYVADASVFPSASGVNPMVTNMAIADWISRRLVKDLKTDGRQSAQL